MDLYDLAATQQAAITRDQLRRLGHTDRQVDHLLATGRLARAAPGVFTLRGAPPTWRQRLSVATLSIPGSMASHRAAARLPGSTGSSGHPSSSWSNGARSVGDNPATPCCTRRSTSRPRTSRRSTASRGTSLVRTLVDLPAVAHEFRVGVALDQAMRHDPALLGRVADRHRGGRRRDATAPSPCGRSWPSGARARLVDSGFERRALRLIHRSPLPTPVTQHHVTDGEVECWLDIAWPARLVAMECDSLRHHMGERAFRWERRRRRLLAAA